MENGVKQYVHDTCFRCMHCSQSLLISGYFYYHDKLYCDKCMDNFIFNWTCERCKQPIKQYSKNDTAISSTDGKQHWHDRCSPWKS